MSKRLKVSELRDLLQKGIVNRDGRVASLKESTNPQIVQVCNRVDSERDILQAVLDALTGNAIILKILCEGE